MPWSDEQKIDIVVKTMLRLVGRRNGQYLGPILAPLNPKDQQVLDKVKEYSNPIWRDFYTDAAAIISVLEREPP